jgi:hypothetical protein
MPSFDPAALLESFQTFGDLLKYFRRQARLTQRELSIAVGYSEAQISRLEQNQRPPDLTAVAALFIPALHLEDQPEAGRRLMDLAVQSRGEEPANKGSFPFDRSNRTGPLETIQVKRSTNNLPLSITTFIGRERELAEIQRLLSPDHKKDRRARLITLTGSGGCGKTRLALEASRRLLEAYQDGIWLIELASISDPDLVLPAILCTLGAPESRGPLRAGTLVNYLLPKHILLILDNCEQVIFVAAQLAEEILRTCPLVHILATSREILNIPGEVQVRVPPLQLPDRKLITRDSFSQSEVGQLFIDRARAALPAFTITDEIAPAAATICHLLDGIPLAIELAAAKVPVLSVQQIAERLRDNFQLLHGGRTTLPQHP